MPSVLQIFRVTATASRQMYPCVVACCVQQPQQHTVHLHVPQQDDGVAVRGLDDRDTQVVDDGHGQRGTLLAAHGSRHRLPPLVTTATPASLLILAVVRMHAMEAHRSEGCTAEQWRRMPTFRENCTRVLTTSAG